ncbi:hypothetical protein [Altererythrobacter sp. MF3-039]|uniref:hypothetical protein n=1 Tax=Altererythrobacter sp. MF3-039 TaxID=3252901 RepID=UPI00390C7EEB
MERDFIEEFFGFKPEDASPEQIKVMKAILERTLIPLEGASEYTKAVGELCSSWAWLDRALDQMFEPILDCPTEQVACIRSDNTGARCNMLSQLLHTIEIPTEWHEWIDGLLTRARGELASRRNRIVHDAWILDESDIRRIDKRPALKSAQAGEPRSLSFDVEHEETAAKVHELISRVFTVTQALRHAHYAISHWRSQGQFPQLDARWLPANKQNAQAHHLQSDPGDAQQLLYPVWP